MRQNIILSQNLLLIWVVCLSICRPSWHRFSEVRAFNRIMSKLIVVLLKHYLVLLQIIGNIHDSVTAAMTWIVDYHWYLVWLGLIVLVDNVARSWHGAQMPWVHHSVERFITVEHVLMYSLLIYPFPMHLHGDIINLFCLVSLIGNWGRNYLHILIDVVECLIRLKWLHLHLLLILEEMNLLIMIKAALIY